MSWTGSAVGLGALLALALSACHPAASSCGAGSSFALAQLGTLQVVDDTGQVWAHGSTWTPPQAGAVLHLHLRNTAAGPDGAPIRLQSIALDAGLLCQRADGAACVAGKWPALLGKVANPECAPAGGVTDIALTLTAVDLAKPAQLTVTAVQSVANTWTLHVVAPGARGQLSCPPLLAIADAAMGSTATARCNNVGDAPLHLTGAKLLGTHTELFEVKVGDLPLAQAWPTPQTLAPGAGIDLPVRLTATPVGHKTTTTLQIHTDGTNKPEVELPIVAWLPGDCLTAQPETVDFAATTVALPVFSTVSLGNCGTTTVALTGAQVLGPDAQTFSIDWDTADFANKPATAQAPFLLEPSAQPTLKLRCTPIAPGPHEALLRVTSQSGTLDVKLSCVGVPAGCPIACMASQPAKLPVHAPVTLDAGCAQAAPGHVLTGWKWTVTGPGGEPGKPQPSAALAKVVWTPHSVGVWTVRLDVTDDAGTGSTACAPLLTPLQVVADDALHATLTWTQAGLPVGATPALLEVHLADLDSGQELPDVDGDGTPDPWFAPCVDTWAINPNPNWGASDSALDDPLFQAGAKGGPHDVGIYAPVPGRLYAIAVYVWSDGKHGPVTPQFTLHAKGLSDLVVTGPALVTGDLWCARRVKWGDAAQSGAPGSTQWLPCPAGKNGEGLSHKWPSPNPAGKYGCGQ